MKLRYLSLKNYGPLKDVDVVFSASSPLNRNCSIRFVVGVNGSGKTHLLKALSEIFISLADWQPPHFPVTLIYELGDGRKMIDGAINLSRIQTIILHSPGKKSQASLWLSQKNFGFPDDAGKSVFDAALLELQRDSEAARKSFRPIIRRGEWTGRESSPQTAYLPKNVLAYTTGAFAPWEQLWKPKVNSEGADVVSQDLEYDWNNERPIGWTYQDEVREAFDAEEDLESDVNPLAPLGKGSAEGKPHGAWQPILLDIRKLKCVLLAVALPQALEDLPKISDEVAAKSFLEEMDLNRETLPGLRGTLARGGWAWPVAVSVIQDIQYDEILAPHDLRQKLDWISNATQVIPEPTPGTKRTLWFDLGAQNKPIKSKERKATDGDAYSSGGASLLNLLGGRETSAFKRFERMLDLFERGVITDVNIMLRKIDHDDLLSFDELSDGEQMVLCRMALFHLLEGQNDVLLLLDEPETHFNDKWKRDVVDIIDSAIGETANEIVISTHAALVLTDALKEEIILMKPLPNMSGSKVFPLGDDVHTFGATSDHPLRDVFGARDTVGRRASKLLEVLLAATAHASDVESLWADELTAEERTRVVKAVLATASVTEGGLDETTVNNCLKVAAQFAEHAEAQKPFSMRSVLETFIDQTGPGYFKIELMRAWRKLKEGTSDAA